MWVLKSLAVMGMILTLGCFGFAGFMTYHSHAYHYKATEAILGFSLLGIMIGLVTIGIGAAIADAEA